MSNHDAAERDLVAAKLEITDDRLDRATEAMNARITALREEWSSGVAQQVAAHEARIRQMQEDNLAWLRSRYEDEPAPSHELAAGDRTAASSGTGHGPRQQSDPYAVELAEAERLKQMPLDEYAKRRAELGIRSAANTGLFG